MHDYNVHDPSTCTKIVKFMVPVEECHENREYRTHAIMRLMLQCCKGNKENTRSFCLTVKIAHVD